MKSKSSKPSFRTIVSYKPKTPFERVKEKFWTELKNVSSEVRRLSSVLMYLFDLLNGPWHRRAMQVFMVIVLAHWLEHLTQVYQLYILGWPQDHSHGAVGLLFPWLVTSAWLHYGYAFIMLVGLALLRPGFWGQARAWWDVALVIQVWHHFEHALLLGQALTKTNLFDSPVPTSLLQLVVPGVQLHFFYNTVVFVPMIVATFCCLHWHRASRSSRTVPRWELRSKQ